MRGREIWIVVAVIATVVVLLLALVAGMMGLGIIGPGFMGRGMMGYRNFGFAPFWMVLMIIFWLLVIGGIAALVWWLVGSNRGPAPYSGGSTQRALEILHERYARGEITKEQYDQMKQDLSEK